MSLKLEWDHYSDQPHVIKDKKLKTALYKKARWDSCKLLFTNLLIYPLSYLHYFIFPTDKGHVNSDRFFGLSVNLDKDNIHTKNLVDELDINNLLIRVPLSDIDNLNSYVAFAKDYKDKSLLINILQDREHIVNKELLAESLTKVFTAFSPLTSRFQLGNAINRKKWAIFSMDEFLRFYKVGYDIRNKKFPTITLLGSSVIDFEYYFSIRTLFNFYSLKFDQFSSLLYVDRRGAPENTQMGFDLTKKLHLLHSLLRLSRKSNNEIVITETNWPITNTAPYAPTSENDCVSLDAQANYLVRYYLLALASGVVKNVYWHQLIAPGYGLIDDRNDQFIKYPSFSAMKTMIKHLQGAKFVAKTIENEIYKIQFSYDKSTIDVFWLTEKALHNSNSRKLTINHSHQKVYMRDGDMCTSRKVLISESPIYRVSKQNHDSSN